MGQTLNKVVRKLVIASIKMYQILVSTWRSPSCRFSPSCSQYTLEAVERFGVRSGLWLGFKRISRCHPWGEYGYDPVPEVRKKENK